jgi:hypothetical protein
VGDTAHPDTPDGLACLAAVTGLATRMVVGRPVAGDTRAQPVVDAPDMAHGRGYVAGNAILHSDYDAENAMPQRGPSPQLFARGNATVAA